MLQHFAEGADDPDVVDLDEDSDLLLKEQIIGFGTLLTLRLREALAGSPHPGHTETLEVPWS